ncbi:hypothetical protein RUM43_007852 [Polyplax serrata]|uniref:Bridge-like lipid transfer protein family member 1 C-terminal domain-containing protein n=1 Tax=Polyplax serrata TaxID=468196 RepID=A0AAN8P2G5_POLSC
MNILPSRNGIEIYNGDFPEASSWNTSSIENSLSNLDIKMDSNFAWLLCSLLSGIIWVTYITYYHSRVLGYILTRILNRHMFAKNGYMKVGSFTWSVLSGKIMFRDIIYMTNDYTLRLQDGWLIFRWWRSYVPKHPSEDLSHSDTRLSIMLNGFELHMYNRTNLYANLEKLFGLESQINVKEEYDNNKEDRETGALTATSNKRTPNLSNSSWRDLFPVIKLDVSSGRIVFGNRLIPTTLSVNVEEAHFVYSIKPAASKLDYFMHILKCVAENFKVILAPSPKYTGLTDEPPRYMGEGFVVFSSNKVDLYYYMDQPGVVPEKPEMLELANGDMVESAPPIWGIDIKCKKGTDFSYGPWADRQREHLFKFFFPNDYQPMQVTKPARPGERRQVQSFDIRLSTQNDATIDVLFSKNKETNAVHINIEPGSYLEITLPWIVQPDGYRTKITGQLLHVEASTSLPYRTLLESETLEFNVKCHYPLMWNDHQELLFSFTGCKTTAHLIYAHKEFFQDLINDWASKASPDLLYFVPYTWKFSWIMKEFEIITLCNNYNWVDCSSQNQENTHISFCGELFDLSFDLPFTEFLPQSIPLRIWIQGESVDMSLYIPEVRTSRNILLALDEHAKIFDRDWNVKTTKKSGGKKWRRVCQRSNGWIDCWSVPIIAISINYVYHPQPPLGPPPQADITTPEKEEILLSPMRIPRCRKPQTFQWGQTKSGGQKFNPMSLPADKVTVDLEIGSSVLLVYGSWIRNFIHLKENIFGDYQQFTDMHREKPVASSTSKDSSTAAGGDGRRENFDPRRYRPFEVVLSITMHDIQAHLIKNCTDKDPPCPMILLERFGLEMKKNYQETMLQVILSPSILLMTDTFTRPTKESHIGQGHLMLSGLQIRGHAMFSDEGRSLDEETIEYAWLIEVQLGKLSGKLTTPQLYHLITSLETLVLLVQDNENALKSPERPRTCLHGTDVNPCTRYEGKKPAICPSTEDIKYRMTRVSLDAVDLFLIESGTAMHLWLSPVRISSCNLHGQRVKSGVSGLLAVVQIKQFICTGTTQPNQSNTNTSSSGRSQQGIPLTKSNVDDLWLEVGSVTFGPLIVEAALSLPAMEQDTQVIQQTFLKLHDEDTKRLWFLWPSKAEDDKTTVGRCGCIGGCAFFGMNKNGKRFFKPSRQDIQDGINIAAFRINDSTTDPGFGQSILHENQLIFHTAPYDSCQAAVQDSYFCSNIPPPVQSKNQSNDRLKVGSPCLKKVEESLTVTDSSSISPSPKTDRRAIRRRFSCTSAGNSKSTAGAGKEVPYFRLIESRTGSLKPVRREPDKAILTVPEQEAQPRSSASDSKLAVDYFERPSEASGDGSATKWNETLHSVSTSLELDENKTMGQAMERTMSITSENQSEVFYSADEDLAATRLSGSRHSIMEVFSHQDNNEIVASRCKFSSESNILPEGLYAKPSHSLPDNNSDRLRIVSHASDLEISTPERRPRSNSKPGSDLGLTFAPISSSPKSIGSVSTGLQHLVESPANENILMDSDTPSISSTSFISAMSSQEDNGLVNLHMQINRPIIEAPLLMSSYINHLSQVVCDNWNQCTVPSGCDAYAIPGALFQKTDEGYLIYEGDNYIPRFRKITEGFTYLKMLQRLNEEPPASPGHFSKTPTHPFAWDDIDSGDKDGEQTGLEEEMLSTSCEAGSRSTIVVKFKGDFDVIITPLVLESLQRFIDSLIPTVSSLHTLTVINHLQFECMQKVKDANILKKEEYLTRLSPPKANVSVPDSARTTNALVQSNIYHENISTQVQGVIALPRINLTLLQASVVEELTPFSALDNIHDFACVSIFAVCLNKATVKFHMEKRAKEIVQTFERPIVTPSQKKGGILTRGSRPLSMGGQPVPPKESTYGEPVYIESSEKQQNETIIMVNLGKMHAQLRRLSNDSSILKDAIITAIPAQYSKVMFICKKQLTPQPFAKSKESQVDVSREEDTAFHDDKIGFIMFEAGFEGVSVKVVKQEHFEKGIKDVSNDSPDKKDLPKESYEKQQQSPSTGGLGQTEHLFGAIKLSAKTATSLNNFIESKALRSKSMSKPFESVKTQPEEKNTVVNPPENPQQQSNISSCVIELATIWFNFAAPPRTPITRKMNYTRLDWNLLSTASPAINAWMNPSSRFASRLVHMFRCTYRRSSGVISCLMAEALEVPEIHVPKKSRYGRLTPLAKALQEDPSCQLCSVLRKYVLQTDLATIEANLTENHLPMLSTLRQGVIVLSRQWKNVLYTPLLLDHNYKTRHVKPLNVTFAMSESDDDVNVMTDGENSNEDNEITDECAVLINNEAGSIMNDLRAQKKAGSFLVKNSEHDIGTSALTSPTFGSGGQKKKHLPPHNMPPSSRASIVFPILNATHPFPMENKFSTTEFNSTSVVAKEYKQSERQLGSNGSSFSNGAPGSHHSLLSLESQPGEDLYAWMAKQQDFIKEEELQNEVKKPQMFDFSTGSGLQNDIRENIPNSVGGYNFYPVHDSLCLLDAHLIFEPLLSALGVMPQQMIRNTNGSSNAVFDTWGSNLSLVAAMEGMRVDIVVSENGRPNEKRRKKSKTGDGKFFLDLPTTMPAFVCERIGLEVDVKKLADMTVDDMIQKQNVLYISRGQLKKHTSTRLNFSINIHYISQQVNMPLLRLLHQISSMYQNVKDTQMELKEQNQKGSHQVGATLTKDHKNESSSASDFQDHFSTTVVDHTIKSNVYNAQTVITNPRSTLSPSSSLLARPQLLAQKLRSTTKSVKGYINLADNIATPMFPNAEEDRSMKPQCWKTIFFLLDLYATMPETKTISHKFAAGPDVIDGVKARKLELKTSDVDIEKCLQDRTNVSVSTPQPTDKGRELNVVTGERTKLVVFGVARIHRTRLLATLSGLKLEAEITNLHSCVTCRKKMKPESLECSLTGQIGRTMIVLLEGVAPNQQTVVKVTVGKSQALYSSLSKRSRDKNSGLLTVGAINIDIPQHPVVLHGMMTRGSKQLSSTLQELGVTRSSRLARGVTVDETDTTVNYSPNYLQTEEPIKPMNAKLSNTSSFLEPLVMQFSIVLQSLSITAALLPSLQAQYKMDQVNSTGITGSKAKFTVDLPRHSLSFTTKLQVTEANLPSEASIDLPKVHVSAEYVQDGKNTAETKLVDGVVLREGSYLNATADIGKFEHSLTTDLLNHLVFVQKVFMKEVNEVLQKVYGGEKVVPLWHEGDESGSSYLKRILFSLVIRIKRIQLTATTPTNSAVRLETGAVEFQLSNRVENVSGSAQPNPYMKIFGKAQVDVNLSLGQLLKNAIFEEADPEFQQFAFFKTRISLRNAFQGEMVQGEDKEVVLITLKRPLVYIQPMAVDKAILVWLNYKNAYDYWNEQRSNLNKEVLTATQQVFEKVPFGQLSSSPYLGTLFLQLTVDDMGICLPLNPLPLTSWGLNRTIYADPESRAAVVITLESTSISACSSGSLVSKGRFVGLCIRFADDFETSLDDWKPDMNDSSIMNLCVVSEGTYEVCSRTIAQKQGKENAKWFLNVQWQMEGVDIHLDVNVGKQLSALGHTLTMLTGSTEEDEVTTLSYDSDEADGVQASEESISQRRYKNVIDSLPSFIFDPSINSKHRSKLIEKEMLEQAKIINDLRSLGASYGTIEQEVKRLQELEALVYKDFRRDMIQKLRRQSMRTAAIKDKFGLSKNSTTFRSRSFIIPSPTPEHALETEGLEDPGPSSVRSEVTSNSYDSPSRSGPSRSASLRVREVTGPRVTFNEIRNICRQSSLPSADSDISLPLDTEWGEVDHIFVDGEKVQLRKKYLDSSYDGLDGLDDTPTDSSPVLPSHSQGMQKSQEPNIDFELDVKVFINSGKCVLHTKDSIKEDDLRLSSKMKKERSCSGGMFDFPPSSPNAGRRRNEKQSSSSNRLRYLQGNAAQLADLTFFHIPGLDVKVHYESKIEVGESTSPYLSVDDSLASPPQNRRPSTKKASLFAWITLQSIPQETIISPHILDFLEKTLEPIPSSSVQPKEVFPSSGHAMFAMDGESTWGANMTTGNYVYASFPVDVMVYFHMEPSTFRFSCLPVSRVECMLQLPSLDIVFSSKRAEEEFQNEFGEICMKTTSNAYSEFGSPPFAIGGLSVTGCLSNFSLHIFHPYGGSKKSALKEAQWSPLGDSERKDSLSVNVEFVKFHLSRSRKINFQSEQQSKGTKTSGFDQSRATIRFSTIVDIGSASFKYDMRRLTEILAFPKAWYRRTIVRRMFLGELNISGIHSEGGDSSPTSLEEDTSLLQKSDSGRHLFETGTQRSSGSSSKSPMMSYKDRERLKLNLNEHKKSRDSDRRSYLDDSQNGTDQTSKPSWETLVLFAVNFTKLRVQMNMGNVMGNVMWLTKDFHSEGRLSIGSTGHKNMYIGLGLGMCNLDAKGGIVGGALDLSTIDTFVHIKEDPGMEPDHTLGLKLFALELRLDYMGTGVLMSRVSSLNVTLRDEWKIHSFKNTESFMPTRRPAMIFMHGDLSWDQLQIMISKSTTADILKMYYKLDEFFSQQFQSSKRVFSSLQPKSHTRSSSLKKKTSRKKLNSTDSSSMSQWPIQDPNHHRHWQHVLSLIAGFKSSTFKIPLPQIGTILGGTMDLHGSNISLACFHGINFKAKSWALFSLKEPCISFATEAQEIASSDEVERKEVHVVQTLTFSLGMSAEQVHAQHLSMATICRMSRNTSFPPQYKTLQEWFNYAFATSDIDSVERFPTLERERGPDELSVEEQKRSRSSSKMQDFNHTREDIFALPTMQLHLKTEHLQSADTPDVTGEKAVVDCSFITEFEDHIFVTIDAEAFFFLHDLISSYLKEKEKVIISAQGVRCHSPEGEKKRDSVTIEDEKKKKTFESGDVFTKDWRTYNCKSWHLEPKVKLWSWAGKSIEPYGVDYILQKLGFSHARTTIPKWVQRGFMDPLDKILAVLMFQMVTVVREGSGESSRRS